MSSKELKCLGVALKALMEAGMYDVVRKVLNVMAEEEPKKTEDED